TACAALEQALLVVLDHAGHARGRPRLLLGQLGARHHAEPPELALIPEQRMPGNVTAERRLLAFQELHAVPLFRRRVFVPGGSRAVAAAGLLEQPEEVRLAALAIAGRAARSLERPIDRRERSSAGDPAGLEHGVEGAALDERF